MNTKTLIFYLACLVAVVILAYIREDVITVITSIAGAGLWRGAHHALRPTDPPTTQPTVPPASLLALMLLPITLSCGGSQAAIDPVFDGASVEVVTTAELTELTAEASARYGLVRGSVAMDVYLDADRAEMSASLALTILEQIGGSIMLSCDAIAGSCEMCILSGKSQVWCHAFEAAP